MQKFLRDMATVCRARDIKFTVVVFPLFDQLANQPCKEIHDRLAACAAEEGIDLLPLFAGRGEPDYWVHPRDFNPIPNAH